MPTQLVVETPEGWMIRCAAHGANGSGFHVFPKKPLPNGAQWSFNGDLFRPTFTPSMNECCNPKDSPHHNPEIPESRCHFIVTNGKINYCGDCTHELRGEMDMLPWSESQVRYCAAVMNGLQ